MEIYLMLVALAAIMIIRLHVKDRERLESEKAHSQAGCPLDEARKKDLELKILRDLANHYAENGYSKAIKSLKEIKDLKETQKENPKTPNEVE